MLFKEDLVSARKKNALFKECKLEEINAELDELATDADRIVDQKRRVKGE